MSYRQTSAPGTTGGRSTGDRIQRAMATGIVVAAVLLLAGCRAAAPATPDADAGTTAGAAGATSTAGAASARSVTVRALGGQRIRIPSERPTVVYFFSATCGSCIQGAHALVQAQQQAQAAQTAATFLAVDLDPTEPPQVIGEFVRAAGNPDLPAVSDRDAALSRRYQVTALSTLVIIDPTGRVTYRATEPSPAQILDAIAKAARR